MKTLYSLKSNIHNSHRIICQDNSNVALEKIDSVFAKLFYSDICDKTTQDVVSFKKVYPHAQTNLAMSYSHDEAIKKYNQKASTQKFLLNQTLSNKIIKKDMLNSHNSKSQKNTVDSKQEFISSLGILESLNLSSFMPHATNQDSINTDSIAQSDRLTNTNNFIIANQDSTLQSTDSVLESTNNGTIQNQNMILVLVNPYKLRDYSFTIPEYITMILNITTKSKVLVYCPLDLNSPLESSEINYLFPIIFNTQTKLAAQIPLSIMDYPDFSKQKLRLYL